MTDISLIPILKSEGWKVMTRSKLKSMKKEELIETIETLENNYGATIERANNSYNYGKSEIERLEKENAELKEQNKIILEDNDTLNKWVDELKAQIEKRECCGNCSKSCFAQDCEDIVNRCDYATSDSLLFKCDKWEIEE